MLHYKYNTLAFLQNIDNKTGGNLLEILWIAVSNGLFFGIRLLK